MRASRPSYRQPIVVSLVALVALGIAASPLLGADLARVAVAAAAVAIAATTWIATRLRAAPSGPPRQPASTLVVESEGIQIERDTDRRDLLLDLASGFGFTLFTSVDRSWLIVALTAPRGTLCIGARFGASERSRFDPLWPHAAAASREDISMALRSPGGETLLVDSTSLLRLVDWLMQIDPTSLGRLMLTDHRGRSLLLDRDRLATPLGTIRLDQPFEWRAVRFRESGAGMDAEFQGTWVRQGLQELVLVALNTTDLRTSLHDIKHDGPRSDALVRNDVRLAEGQRSLPPPLEQRIAVDRMFMLPLRRALDGAHVETRDSIPGGAPLG